MRPPKQTCSLRRSRLMNTPARLARTDFADQNWLAHIVRGKQCLEILDLGQIVDDNVRIARVFYEKVLLRLLDRIKAGERIDARDNGARKYLGLIQLRDIGIGNLLLAGIAVKDFRA